jgi:transposase
LILIQAPSPRGARSVESTPAGLQGGGSHELLYAAAQALLRGRFALADDVPLHRRTGRGVLLHRNLPCNRDRFLLAIAPYREDLVVAVECVYSWYWLADLCAKEGIRFVLGHALYMRLIHGAKAKSDRVDSEKAAVLLRGGLMPRAYAYPADMRATRDLMRRRLLFVRQRGSLLAHIQITHHQYNVDPPGKRITYRSNREGLGEGFEDSSVRHSIAADLALADHYEVIIGELELAVLRQARIHEPNALALLTSVPGIGKVLALTILYEIHDISRFPSVRDFASYSRLVKCERSSAGKSLGSGGNKIGNAYLKWAFSEAAVLFIAKSEQGRTVLTRLERKYGKPKALSVLAHKLGRAVYYMLARKQAFDPQRFATS